MSKPVLHYLTLFTSRKWSFGKVMFSQASVCSRGDWVGVSVSHQIRGPTPPPGHKIWGATPCYWHLVVITADLFKLFHLRTYSHLKRYWFLVVATETYTVGKQAVRILLECWLLFKILNFLKIIKVNLKFTSESDKSYSFISANRQLACTKICSSNGIATTVVWPRSEWNFRPNRSVWKRTLSIKLTCFKISWYRQLRASKYLKTPFIILEMFNILPHTVYTVVVTLNQFPSNKPSF